MSCNYQPDPFGLVLVICILANGCEVKEHVKKLEAALERIEARDVVPVPAEALPVERDQEA